MDKNIKLLTAVNFFSDLSLWDPLAIIYFSQITGSYVTGISIFSIIMISQALFEVPTGIFSDFLGRKNTTVAATFCFFLATVFYALGNSYLTLIIAALINGLGRSFSSGNNDALLFDYVAANPKLKFETVSGHVESASQWALGIGAVFGIYFITYFELKTLVTISIIPAFICFILSLLLDSTRAISRENDNIIIHIKTALKYFFQNRSLRLLSLNHIIGFGIGESAYQFRSAFFATLWPLWAINITRIISNILAALSFNFSGKILARFSHLKIIITQEIYSHIATFISLLFPTPLSPILMSTTSAFFGIGTIAQKTLLQQEFSDRQRATMGSLNALGGNIFFAIFAIFIGLIADNTSPATALIFAQAVSMSTLYLLFSLAKIKKN